MGNALTSINSGRSPLKNRIWIRSWVFLWRSRQHRLEGALTVFNAANELAVKLFLQEKIRFLDIYQIIGQSMGRHKVIRHPDLDQILAVEKETYQWIESRW